MSRLRAFGIGIECYRKCFPGLRNVRHASVMAELVLVETSIAAADSQIPRVVTGMTVTAADADVVAEVTPLLASDHDVAAEGTLLLASGHDIEEYQAQHCLEVADRSQVAAADIWGLFVSVPDRSGVVDFPSETQAYGGLQDMGFVELAPQRPVDYRGQDGESQILLAELAGDFHLIERAVRGVKAPEAWTLRVELRQDQWPMALREILLTPVPLP